jgi:hypothetical protein
MSVNYSYIKTQQEVEAEQKEKCYKEAEQNSKKLYREIDVESNTIDPNRNYELEKRIKLIEKHNKDYGINLYGGMGLDSVSNDIRLLRLEELKYMKDNPQLYQYKQR